MAGTLYLIPNLLTQTPEDQRDPLNSVIPSDVQAITADLDYFIAENAKSTRAFLKRLSSSRALRLPIQEIQIAELNVNTAPARLPELLAPLLAGRDAGLISEAGVPAVADPGGNLVRLAHKSGIKVRPLVGPSSILLAVMASGLNGQSFAFNGYLPIDAQLRLQRIKVLEERSRAENQTQLFIETPYRNQSMLEAITGACQGSTLVTVATALTSPVECIATKSVNAWRKDLASNNGPDIHKKATVFLLLAE